MVASKDPPRGSPLRARSCAAKESIVAGATGAPPMAAARKRISATTLRVKLSTSTGRSELPASEMQRSMRVYVFPVPGPAVTSACSDAGAEMICCCSGVGVEVASFGALNGSQPYADAARRAATARSTHSAASAGSSCSHIRRTTQPSSSRRAVVSRSRARLPSSLLRHQSALAFGQVACSGQACQKQPSTNTATFSRGNAMSIRRLRYPSSGRWRRNLSPIAKSRRRSSTSGVVSARLASLIRRLTLGSLATIALARAGDWVIAGSTTRNIVFGSGASRPARRLAWTRLGPIRQLHSRPWLSD